ncbi:MAG TPA: TRAP transporter substrate-binding protein DctP, partial [Dehalococcoidales bacterium]|nr:TRAP transporter substrate-binding protein DctP [Dehalococcoidales bacterium]
PAQPPKVINWKCQTAFVTGDPWITVGEAVVDRINKASGGRLVVDLLPAGAVVPATEEVDGIRTAAIDLAHTCGGYMLNLNSAAAFFDQMPGGLTNVQLKYWYTAGEGDALGQEMVGPFGATWLNNWLAAPEDFAYTNIPLETLDDIKKLKMRSAGLGAEVLTEMGASIVFLPGGEIYESMQRGVINAFEYGSADNAWDMGFQEVIDYLYVSLTRAPSDGGIIVARTDSFNALPDDLKLIVDLASESGREVYYDSSIVKVAEALQKIKDYGVKVQPLPKEIEDAFLAEAEAYMDKKMATEPPFFKRVVESQRAFKKLCEAQGIY